MSDDARNGGIERSPGRDLETIRAAWQVLQQDEPPKLLDQSVRNQARRALPARRRLRSLHWLGSLATAAVVILAVAIVIQQDQQGPVPPVPKSDGFRLDEAADTEERVGETRAIEQDPGSTEIMLQRAAPAAASERMPPIAEEAVPGVLEEAMEADAAAPAPEDWVERLLQLQQAGRQEEFRAELEAFRQAYPRYPLPPALRE